MNPPSPSIAELIGALSRPAAYPFPVDAVDVRQTHISAVFLANDLAFKVKKPVKLPFLDFSTLELRKHYCDEEVRLNRRLARDVYLEVVPVRATATGLRVDCGEGPIVDWAVKMARLPDDAMFASRMDRGELTGAQVKMLAERMAAFHGAAQIPRGVDDPRAARIADEGRFERVATAVRDNLAYAQKLVGQTIALPVYERLLLATEQSLARLKPLLQRRAATGMIRDLHGDLHLDHIYLFDDRRPPSDLVIVDCIEFSDAFRFIDVVADIAFCAMDFKFHGRHDFARTFCTEYFRATGDTEGPDLLEFYTAYRAAVRGKVDGILAQEPEVPQARRAAAATRSSAYWLLALGELEPADTRPALVLVSGLPGTGKSTVARGLSESAGFQWVRSDAVRKKLAAAEGKLSGGMASDYLSGIYSPEWTERTYAECLNRAIVALRLGGRVVVDATFIEDRRRCEFLTAAIECGVPAAWLVCDAPAEVVRGRLAQRRNDQSDADWSIYQKAASAWQQPSPLSQRVRIDINANQSQSAMLDEGLAAVAALLS